MIILTDVDGVLADCVGAICRTLNQQGFSRQPKDFQHFAFTSSLSYTETALALSAMSKKGFAASLEWYPSAKGFAWALEGVGEVHAVTAPFTKSVTWMSERVDWLSKHIPAERVHFTSTRYKHMVRGDVLIEDHPGTAAMWLYAHPEGQAILIDRPWNQETAQEFKDHPRMHRARSFDQALGIIRSL